MPRETRQRVTRSRTTRDDAYDNLEGLAVLEQELATLAQQQRDESQALRSSIRDTLSLVERQGVEFRKEMQTLGEKFVDSRQPNWILIFAALAFMCTLIGGGWVIIRQQTENTVNNAVSHYSEFHGETTNKMRSDLDQLNGQLIAANLERKQAMDAVTELRKETVETSTNYHVIIAKLAEVETQFRASDQARNVQFAEQQRTNNIIMQVAQGGGKEGKPALIYPFAPFYHPGIAGDGNQNSP